MDNAPEILRTGDDPGGLTPSEAAPTGATLRLGRYQVEQEIGRGFSSVVYEALDTARERVVALKVLSFLHNLSAEGREDMSERFAREARAISALSHPGIVAIYEIGQAADGREFIAMEYLRGESLRARLNRVGALPPEEAVPIVLQVADALQYAHERGVVHRDIKPDNVFLLPDGQVKLMDFGVAQLLSDGTLTQAGTVVGSPAYMSPEQIHGEHLDGRTDVFSLGVMLAEMVVGHKPFEAPSIPAVMNRILNQPPQMASIAPRALRRIIEKALAKTRAGRYQSASALAEDLRRHVLPRLSAWEPTSTVIMDLPLRPADGIPAGSDRPLTAPSRKGFWLMAAVAGLLLLAALLWGAVRHPMRPPAHAGQVAQVAPLGRGPDGGTVHHIPAYWRRSAAHTPASDIPRTHKPHSVADQSAVRDNGVRIVETVPAHAPKRPAPEKPARTVTTRLSDTGGVGNSSPRIALGPTRSDASHRSAVTPVVVKVAGSHQELTVPPPVDASPHIPAPGADPDADAPVPPALLPDTGPHLSHKTPLLYPRGVPEETLVGTALLRVRVDEDGKVTGVTIQHTSGLTVVDDAAMETVRHWEYDPAFKNGQPVPGVVTERLTYTP